MTDPRAYSAPEIIEKMAQIWCPGSLNECAPITKKTYLDNARRAYLLSLQLGGVPTEGQIEDQLGLGI